jgi:hypothetical protein
MLSDPAIADPTFTPDLVGAYVLSLTAGDGLNTSDPDTLTINASPGPCATSTVPTSGLLAYWHMSGNADDTAGGGHHATPVGRASLVDDRHEPAGAYTFDGVDDHLDIPFDPSLEPPLPVTIAAWVKHDRGGQVFCPIFLNNRSNTATYSGARLSLVKSGAPETIRLYAEFGDATFPSNFQNKIGTTEIPAGEWHHVPAVIRGDDDIELYVDGVDDGGSYAGSATTMGYVAGNASIGRSMPVAPSSYFTGEIDEVAFYDRALSPAEIQQLIEPCQTPTAVPAMGPFGVAAIAMFFGAAGAVALRRRAA